MKEFGDLIPQYSADASARNNLALCSTYLRDMPRAVTEMRKVVAILPKRALYRENLALYAAYSGDVKTPAEEARAFEEPGMFALLAVAFSQLLQGQLPEATATYQSLAKIDERVLPTRRRASATSRFTRGACRMRSPSSRRAPRPIWRPTIPTAPRTNLPRWRTARSCEGR